MKNLGILTIMILVAKIVFAIWLVFTIIHILSNPASIGNWFGEIVNSFNAAK